MDNNLDINKIWDSFPEIKTELQRCKKFMLESIDIPNRKVRNEVVKLINSDAKFIRPALMILVGKLLNNGEHLDEDFIKIASTMEMLHMATLIHDDIIDNSDLRRGVPALQSTMGKDVAVYAGDYMLSSVFRNVLNYAKTIENAKLITESVNKILSGELIQMEKRGDFSITEESYYSIINGKTAVLLALCCYEGAYMTGSCKEDVEKAWKLGNAVGMAFQIIDDILDLTTDPQNSKKTVNRDFKEGNFTLPVIYSFNKFSDELKNIKENGGNDPQKFERVKDIVRISGGLDYSAKRAREFTELADSIISSYDDSLFKNYLTKVVAKLLNRIY